MKFRNVVFVSVMVFVGLLAFVLPSAEAQAVSCDTTGTCRGTAFTRTNGVSGHIRFCLTVAEFTCPSSATAVVNQAAWELDAGDCVDVFYIRVQSGAVPPALPDNVVLQVLYDTTSSLVIEYHDGAEPTNGQDYEFCATDDGTSTGDPRAGTYRLFLEASVGGVSPYTTNSDGTGGDENNWAMGAMRGNIQISSAGADSPPSGSIFAYGPSGDEDVTVTFEVTERAGDNNIETMQVLVTTDAMVVIGGTIMEPVGDTMEESFTVGDSFLEAEQEYNIALDIEGDSALTGLKWTVYADSGHAGGIVVDSSTRAGVVDEFTADPRVQRDGFSCVESLLNRGESIDCDISVLNARLQAVTKSVRFNVIDSDAAVQSTQDLSGDPKNLVYAIGLSDGAAATSAGAQWTYTITPVDTYDLGGADLVSVSSLYFCDVHPQTMTPLVKDDFPTQDASENETYFLGSDNIHVWGHVAGVRLDGTEVDTSGSAVTIEFVRPNAVVYASYMTDTGVDGWTPAVNETPVPPPGAWSVDLAVSYQGNSCSESQVVQFVSSFTENLVLRLLFNHTVEAGEEVAIFVRSEVDDAAAVPGGVPVLKISRVNYSGVPFVWEDVVALTPMLNVDDYTATVSGTLYQYNFTPPMPGTYNVWVRAPLNSAPIRESSNLLSATGVETLTNFEEAVGLTALEFFLFVAVTFTGVILWSRSKDMVVKAFGAVLPVLAGALLIFMAVSIGVGSTWNGIIPMAALMIVTGLYLFIRMVVDELSERGVV